MVGSALFYYQRVSWYCVRYSCTKGFIVQPVIVCQSNDRDTSTRCVICAKLIIKTKEEFDNVVSVSLLFTLDMLPVLP